MIEVIKIKIEELRSMGKNKVELELWECLLPIMNDEEKNDLLKSLEEELNFIRRKLN